jgi:hypothetical protein
MKKEKSKVISEVKSFNYYNEILKIIESHMGNEITDENQLRSLGNDILGTTSFKGVFPVDKMSKLKNKQCCIINLDTSDMPGSHWVSIYKNKSKYCIYDSFGRRSSKILPSLIEKRNTSFVKSFQDSDYDAEQRIDENNCGQRCLAWLYCIKDIGIDNALKI